MEVVKSKIVVDALAGEGTGVVVSRIQMLHRCNARLWKLEEAVRDRGLSQPEVVRLKRAIDGENLSRHAAIAALDGLFDARFGPQRAPDDPEAVVNSESLGQLVDRLSVLALKLEHHTDSVKLAALQGRRALVVRCFDRVTYALARGDGITQTFDEAKTYSA